MSDTLAPDASLTSQPQKFETIGEEDLLLDGPDDNFEMTEDLLVDKEEGKVIAERPDPEEDTSKTTKEPEKPVETTTEAPPEKPVETQPQPTAQTQELPQEVKAQVEYFNEFDKALRENPTEVASAIFGNMDARQKAAFLQEIGAAEAQSQYPEFNADEYEPQSDMESAVKARWKDLDTIPQLIRENRDLDTRIGQTYDEFANALNTVVPQIREGNVWAQLALEKIDALCKALDITLPDPDIEALRKEINPGVQYRDAIRKVVNYGTAIEVHKQKNAPRPIDTINESKRETLNVDPNDPDFAVKLARQMGSIPPR